MNTHDHSENTFACDAPIQESRSPRFNLAVEHPAKWRVLLEQLLAPSMRLHRYRNLSVRMFEDTIDKHDCGVRK